MSSLGMQLWLNFGVSIVVLGGTILTVFFSYKSINKQIKNSPQIAKDFLPTLLEIVENLDLLDEALCFDGRLCPSIEHRCPTLSQGDGEADYSYAQRAHLFLSSGRKIVKNCREIIWLTPKGDLSETIEKLKEIKEYLTEKEPGKRSTLGRIHQYLLSVMGGEEREINRKEGEGQVYKEKIPSFRDSLDQLIEEELPKLRKV